MTACNCVNPSPNCPCHQSVIPPQTSRYPYWWWLYPPTCPRPVTTITTKTTFVSAPRPDIPALRPEDV